MSLSRWARAYPTVPTPHAGSQLSHAVRYRSKPLQDLSRGLARVAVSLYRSGLEAQLIGHDSVELAKARIFRDWLAVIRGDDLANALEKFSSGQQRIGWVLIAKSPLHSERVLAEHRIVANE